MSEIKALEKLRAAGRNMAKGRNLENHEECNLLLVIADEIKAEIEREYMRLPVDADGLPIRVGDKLVRAITEDGIIYTVAKLKFDGRYWWYESGDDCFACDCAKHKPRTVEDVLLEAIGYGTTLDTPGSYDRDVLESLASELRMRDAE